MAVPGSSPFPQSDADISAPGRSKPIIPTPSLSGPPLLKQALNEAGYSTKLQARDFAPGQDFVQEMQQAATSAARTIAVLSPAYFHSRFTGSEWAAAFAQDPKGELRTLIPIRVVDFEPPGLLRSRIYVDLVGKNEAAAREAVVQGVAAAGVRPRQAAA